MSKEQWIARQEEICEDFAFERIDMETALGRLVTHGFKIEEAEALLTEAIA